MPKLNSNRRVFGRRSGGGVPHYPEREDRKPKSEAPVKRTGAWSPETEFLNENRQGAHGARHG